MVCALSIAPRVPAQRNAFEAGKFFRKIDPAAKFEATLSSTRFTGVSTNGNFSRKRENEAERGRKRGKGSLDMVVNVRFSDTQVALQVAESWEIYSWLRGERAVSGLRGGLT